ncbi:hypothetical protein [Geodermatophilus sp. DSM 44513]|uniref:hypothetical protein n=1 Tax=Geodermatophilus sp. DSM 44513 TaxID=1528104 RepID=UPI00127BA919|nr:hypothetical protein [Geodermatophilus sp. DSM 44513]WNV74452.1 hypothetical protein RTG05_15855 [Geodermatophilus sp. DSM 44513]
MPLPEGVPLDRVTSAASRPEEPACAMEDVPVLFPDGDVRGRRASDGTNWCRCCDTTISTHARAAFCLQHRTERNTQIQQSRRGQDRPPVVGVRAEVVDTIVGKTDRLLAALGRATAEFNRMPNPPVGSWIDDLMLVAKDLSLAVDYGLRPVSSHQRMPERDRQPRSTAPQE